MFRRLLSGIAVVIMAAASSVAPFAHFHPEGVRHDHPASGFAHVHLPVNHLESHGPEWTLPVPEQVYMEWLPVAAERVLVAPALVSTLFSWKPTFTSFSWAPELEHRSHSPPPRRLLSARAPPL